jgi:hypothetical protein
MIGTVITVPIMTAIGLVVPRPITIVTGHDRRGDDPRRSRS